MDVNQLLNQVEAKGVKKDHSSKKDDKSFNNVMGSISRNWKVESSQEVDLLKKELEKAKREITNLKLGDPNLTKNEQKVLSAIRSEILIQNTEYPIISYNKFRKIYKVSSSYYRISVSSLLNKRLIKQKETKFSGKVKTFKWEIINQKSLRDDNDLKKDFR